MPYLFFILIIVFVFVIVMQSGMTARRKKMLDQLKAGWGKLKTDDFNFDEIGLYTLQNHQPSFHQLIEQTRVDIDFNELFAFVDRTNSHVGQQYLFDRMQKPGNNIAELKSLSDKARFFTDNVKAREEVQEILVSLNNSNSYYIAALLNGKLAERPKWFRLLIIDTAIVISILLLSVKFSVLLIWMMIPFALNMGLHLWNKNNTYRFLRSLPQLNKLIRVADKLTGKQLPFEKEKVMIAIYRLKTFQRKMRFLSFGQQGMAAELTQVYYYFIELVKAIFLIELHVFYSIVKELEDKQDAVNDVFTYVGIIDTGMSIASLRAGSQQMCEPEFINNGKKMAAVKVYHPLIEDCVTNDLTVTSKSILITGSNMSGKTTFLRTIAINSILAQTLYTCFAEVFSVPILKLSSSIRIDDSVTDGKSYYLEEVDVMSKLIGQIKPDQQNLFILDEVFKGTNTIERIAAGKAILYYLNRFNNIVLVSTHDMELTEMLAGEYDLYHFVEIIQENQLFIDHLLKAGQLKTRNAIKILEMSDYPEAIITEAKEISIRITMLNIT